jgi:phage terminase Nu1 subunit (DNA packaging protein)
MGKIVSKAELAIILGNNEKTIFRWQKEGLPIEQQGSRGKESKFDTEKVIHWLMNRSNSTDEELKKSRIRMANAQAEKTEIEIEEMRNNLIALDKMKDLWAGVLGKFRARILSIPSRLTPQIAIQRDPKMIEKLIKEALYEALNELAEYDLETNNKRTSRRKASIARSGRSTAA